MGMNHLGAERVISYCVGEPNVSEPNELNLTSLIHMAQCSPFQYSSLSLGHF